MGRKELDQLEKEGDTFFEGKMYETAATLYEKAELPEKAGDTYVLAGNFEKAIEIYTKNELIEKCEKKAVDACIKGNLTDKFPRLAEKGGEYEKAAEGFLKIGYLIYAAKNFEKAGKKERSQELFLLAADQHATESYKGFDHPLIHFLKIPELYSKAGLDDKTSKLRLANMVEKDAMTKGTYHSVRRLGGAIKIYNDLGIKDVNFEDAVNFLGEKKLKERDYVSAENCFSVIKNREGRIKVKRARGEEAMRTGRYSDACSQFIGFEELKPEYKKARIAKARNEKYFDYWDVSSLVRDYKEFGLPTEELVRKIASKGQDDYLFRCYEELGDMKSYLELAKSRNSLKHVVFAYKKLGMTEDEKEDLIKLTKEYEWKYKPRFIGSVYELAGEFDLAAKTYISGNLPDLAKELLKKKPSN